MPSPRPSGTFTPRLSLLLYCCKSHCSPGIVYIVSVLLCVHFRALVCYSAVTLLFTLLPCLFYFVSFVSVYVGAIFCGDVSVNVFSKCSCWRSQFCIWCCWCCRCRRFLFVVTFDRVFIFVGGRHNISQSNSNVQCRIIVCARVAVCLLVAGAFAVGFVRFSVEVHAFHGVLSFF